jgi:hypothetical protein
MVSIDEFMDAAQDRQLTDEELKLIERELRENDHAIAHFLKRCQLESDLYIFLRGGSPAKVLLADIESLSHKLENKPLPRPADGAE